MALVNCKECGEGISSKAKECPRCGAPIVSKSAKIRKLLGFILILIGFLGVLYYWSTLRDALGF